MVVMPAKGRDEAATMTGEACAESIEAPAKTTAGKREKRERRVAAWCEVKKRVLWAASWSVVLDQWACMTPVVE